MSTTERPKAAAAAATERPPEPAPMTHRSAKISSLARRPATSRGDVPRAPRPPVGSAATLARTVAADLSGCIRLAPLLQGDRDQCDDAEQGERGEELGRDERARVDGVGARGVRATGM